MASTICTLAVRNGVAINSHRTVVQNREKAVRVAATSASRRDGMTLPPCLCDKGRLAVLSFILRVYGDTDGLVVAWNSVQQLPGLSLGSRALRSRCDGIVSEFAPRHEPENSE
eukprot:3630682-Pyramimonas_sp.AAC.1